MQSDPTPVLAAAIVAVILLNAGFAFFQELQAERAVEALAAYLPTHARVMRDGQKVEVEARTLNCATTEIIRPRRQPRPVA